MAARARRRREVGRCLQSSQIKLLQASLPRWVGLSVENLKLADSDPSFIRYFFGVSIPPSTPSLSICLPLRPKRPRSWSLASPRPSSPSRLLLGIYKRRSRLWGNLRIWKTGVGCASHLHRAWRYIFSKLIMFSGLWSTSHTFPTVFMKKLCAPSLVSLGLWPILDLEGDNHKLILTLLLDTTGFSEQLIHDRYSGLRRLVALVALHLLSSNTGRWQRWVFKLFTFNRNRWEVNYVRILGWL